MRARRPWRVKWTVLWSLWLARAVRQPTEPLRVSGGALRGSVAHDGSHRHYLGVPYATAGRHNRFQAPDPEPKWDGVFEAHNEHIRCTQRFSPTLVVGQRDCLTLNVFTPLHTSAKLRPVMVFIHGGGFRDGSGSVAIYGPEYLVKHEVILVTFNYRLEVIGFLCLGIKEAPGNAGMKDQVAALKWIKRNIKVFGGDPDNVTLFGESAGSSSVLYHLMSPMSKGLFHRAIMQSGSAISSWSLQFEPLKTASLLAKQMGHNTKNPYEIYKIFMNKTDEELLKIRVPRAEGDVVLSENIFVPCVEKEIFDTERFLTDTPYNLIRNSKYQKMPLIIGYNNAEGYMFVGKENDTTIAKFDFYKALPRDLIFPKEKQKIETAEKLKQLYMGDEKVNKETLIKFSKFEGDSGIVFPVLSTTELLLRTGNELLYSYKLCYDGWMNIVKYYFGFGHAKGATHADDLFYMFKPKLPFPQAFFETDMINKITVMWTNFAKYGDPTPETTPLLPTKWRPADKRDPLSLVIDKQFSTVPLWNDSVHLFWNSTYTKYRRKY